MPVYLNGQVGPQSVGNGPSAALRQDKTGSLVTHEQYGKHFEPCLQGQSFLYMIASQAFLLSATTGGHPTVINPSGSGVIFVPTMLTATFISGTTVIGGVVVATTLNAGAGAATAAPIATATLVAPKPALRGGGGVAKCYWSPTTNTFTAAPVVEYATSLNFGAADPTNSGNPHTHLFNGTLAYYPGTAMSICYTVTTSTALFAITLCGIEIPLPPGS